MTLQTAEKPIAREAAAPPAIAVQSLFITHFRNYASLRLQVDTRPVILTGHNGAGKTNLLEAVSLLAPGRGMRRAKLADMESQSSENTRWAIAAEVMTPMGEVMIGTGREEGAEESDKRIVKIDGKTARGHTVLANYVSVVWLTPQMDQLFQEGQSARRKFIDRLVYSFDAEHAGRVSAYEYAMRERNRLLADGRADPFWLTSLEQKLAESAVAIAAARLQTISHINEVMHTFQLHFPKAELSISGFAEDALFRGEAAVSVEQQLGGALESTRREDAASGRTSLGAHRSELTVMHSRKNMEAAFCSTGEQKALLLAIVLAEARAGALWHGRVPILLLDEVVAHLDPEKRGELFEEIQSIGAQAWMTGTDKELFQGMLGKASFFRVEMGAVNTL